MRTAALFLLLTTARAADLSSLARAIRAEVKPDEAMEYVHRVWSTDRWSTFPKYHETAASLRRAMTDAGLARVEVLGAPADGKTQAGFWTMPLAWDARSATLEIVDPAVPAESRILADYEKTPGSLCMWSGPTPSEGITAGVVEYSEQASIAGKFVVTAQNAGNLKWQLARGHAAGAINAFTENRDLKDGRQWVNSGGDYGWPFTKTSTPLPCFSISPRQADFLRGLMAKGPVRVRAKVDARYYEDTYPYVTGLIPGAGSDEEVLTLGHSSEQGANDNATGVAAMLEAMATLKRMIGAGKLPPPRRGMRVLAMGELFASMHYIQTNPERIRRTVAAMCLDTPAASYQLAGTEYTFYQNPHAGWSFVDSFVLRVADAALAPRPWHVRPYMTGTDNYLGEPSVGIPTAWPYSGTGIHTHHNTEDTPETVDPRSLRDLAALDAVFLYYLASAGENEARWLAEVALTYGLERIARAAAPDIDRLGSSADRGRWLYDALDRVRYTVDREKQAVGSAARLAPGIRASLDPLLAQLDRFGREQSDRVRRLAGAVEPVATPDVPGADRIVVKRKRFGTIPLDDLAPDRREGYPSGAWATVPVTALYWCDGRRNLTEVIRLTRLETGPANFDFVGYFRFLRKLGYVDFVEW